VSDPSQVARGTAEYDRDTEMRAPLLALATIVIGCGSRSGLLSLEDETGVVDGTVGLPDASVVVRDSSVVRDSAVVRDTADATACVADTDALVAKIEPGVGSCTTVLLLTWNGGLIRAYKMFCGPYGRIDEATAAKQSQMETGVGVADCFGSKSVTGEKAEDEFLFFQGASAAACDCCGDGWFTAVSARNALTVVGGDIVFGDGSGAAHFPKSLDPATDLGTACATGIPLPRVRGFDLTKMGGPGTAPPALPAPVMEAALRTIWRTALPEALARKQYIFDAMVLLYSSMAVPIPDSEPILVVLLNSGWLE
jgi:hypothetical protein